MTHPQPLEGRNLLEGLNPAQREAVEHVDGPLLIVAGPGSGKTRVITHRIAYLVQVCGVTPYSILAMTFTNKAAREMRDRLNRLVGSHSDALTVGTFHSFCARLLRREGERVGLPRNYSIFDDDDQMAAIRHCLEEADYDPKRYPPRAVLAAISRAKSVLHDSQTMAQRAVGDHFEEVCARVYRHYEELLARNGAADFDDLLLRTAQLFREFPDVLQARQQQYNYLMVDEFQDTNIAQYRISQMLARSHQNFCVVGDPDQSIYSWRSADVSIINNFETDYPRAKVIRLGQNYRSTKNILEAAKGLIKSNVQRLENNLSTENRTGLPVQLYEAGDERGEADFVATEIKRLHEDGFKPGACAVLYRINAQGQALENALNDQGIKYRLVGGTSFYQRREIRDLTAYLRLLHNQQDDVNLARVVGVPRRGIGAQTMQQLAEWSSVREISMFEAMREIAAAKVSKKPYPAPLTSRPATAIAGFTATIDSLISLSREVEVDKLVDAVLEESGLRKHIQESDDRPEERWENVLAFRDMAQEFNSETPPDGLESLLERTALVAQVDEYENSEETATLITLHQAKGLEFPVVFIVGLEQGLLPHSRSMDKADQLEEERRLCYVGMTRAQKMLYLIRARGWRGYMGGGRTNRPGQTCLQPGVYWSVCPCGREKHLNRGDEFPNCGGGHRDVTWMPVRTLASSFLSDIPKDKKVVITGLRKSAPTVSPTLGHGRSMFGADRRGNSASYKGAESPRTPGRRRSIQAAAAPTPPVVFGIGDRVRHEKFGEGIVIDSDASALLVTIEFESGVGAKRLDATHKMLEKLDD